MKFRPSFPLVLVALAPSAASACTVCFGGADANLVDGFFWGVIVLLALPFAMTAIIITKIARASRKRSAS